MKEYVFRLGTLPQPKQSFRARAVRGETEKEDKVIGYTEAEIKKYQKALVWEMRSQIKPPVVRLTGPLKLEVTYVFPFLKSHTKSQREAVAGGATLWKDTKPDVTDNLNKPVADAMEGLIMANDSQIAQILASKMYGPKGCIIARISTLPQP